MENDNTNNNASTIERQELYCHACRRYVQFDIDTSIDGNYVIVCPNCKHEHYRVVKNGIITEDRWGSTNNLSSYMMVNVATMTTSQNSTFSLYSRGTYNASIFLYMSWMNTNATG